ncbi:MAG TPA: hypothetical protein VG013_00615 [Gemmataceae bacterium]|jgi:hypothetical protein|nr:hypothetical protein [Gemmataceae bacterium]
MKQTLGMMVLAAALGGCMSMDGGPSTGAAPHFGCGSGMAPAVPGVQGPWGTPVAMAAPYSSVPPGTQLAYGMMSRSVPLNYVHNAATPAGPSGIVQASASMPADGPSDIMLAGGCCPPGGCPPAGALCPPGVPFAPGMPGMMPPPGAVAAVGAMSGPAPNGFAAHRTEVHFISPLDMKVAWFAPGSDGKAGVGGTQLTVMGRYNFVQGAIYRLKLSDIPQHPGLELYPTLEVVPSNLRTDTFLAHSSVPLAFTEDDFEQVTAGNYVVKVIYLPDPQNQDLATTGTNEVVSTQLEPGIDPIAEAYRRGSILLVIRLGNIDLEARNTPPMDAPNPYGAPHGMPCTPPMGMGTPGPLAPYGAMGMGQPQMMAPNQPLSGPYGAMGIHPPMMGNPAMQSGAMLPPPAPDATSQPRATPGTPAAKADTPAADAVPASLQTTSDGSAASSDGTSRRHWGLRHLLFGSKSDSQAQTP